MNHDPTAMDSVCPRCGRSECRRFRLISGNSMSKAIEDCNKHCLHTRARPYVADQTLGAECLDCSVSHVCWMDDHVPEALWNKALAYVQTRPAAPGEDDWRDGIPCPDSREDVCAICQQKIES